MHGNIAKLYGGRVDDNEIIYKYVKGQGWVATRETRYSLRQLIEEYGRLYKNDYFEQAAATLYGINGRR